MSLLEHGEMYGTDKVAHGYLPIYERYLACRDIRSVLEIGVYGGKSLRMWRAYFPQAQIYGLDIDPECKRHSSQNIRVVTGSQDDPATLDYIVGLSGGFDLVVDDGSHVNSLTLASFEHLWPHTRQVYVIEDLGCSYVDLTPHVASWPGMQHNSGVDYRNQRSDIDSFFVRAIQQVDHSKVAELHFHRDLAVFVR